ncbi:hypothetical protein BLNAU_3365 [Blattamonas nauphoetae]|uniref:Uncharacterized protein n=1 Tax=Blattamonas nauphoetae TaxID=2049346 RepID=A0ABQ9YCU8_9EUKA|nr:hypothetical protein BLNAU_3365 [Blattamonas nauphoetae]
MDYPTQTAPQQIPSQLHNNCSPLLFNMSKGSPTEQLSPLLQHNFTANSGTPTPTPTFSPLATNPFMNLVHSTRTNTHHPDTDKYLSLNNLNETTESLSQRSTFTSFSLVSRQSIHTTTDTRSLSHKLFDHNTDHEQSRFGNHAFVFLNRHWESAFDGFDRADGGDHGRRAEALPTQRVAQHAEQKHNTRGEERERI